MTEGRCRCGHWDGEHFDEVKACARCECAAFRQEPGLVDADAYEPPTWEAGHE